MSDDDRPTLRVGDYVIDRETEAGSDEEPSVMLVVELTLERADAVSIDARTTVADVNDDQYATDDVVRAIYPLAGRRARLKVRDDSGSRSKVAIPSKSTKPTTRTPPATRGVTRARQYGRLVPD